MNARVRSIVRPDGRYLVRCEGAWTADDARDAVAVARELELPVMAHVDAGAKEERAALVDAGFAVSRREARVVVDVETALRSLRSADVPAYVVVRSAADVDVDALRRLDDELRDDVPGTAGWRSSPAEFYEDTFGDPAFDPRTYLAAVDRASGELLGLVRIWMNPDGPRLGLLGVRRDHRRRGLGSALLARGFASVRARGGSRVVTEFDETNDASRTLAERLGAAPAGTTIELVCAPDPRSDFGASQRLEAAHVEP